MSLHSPEPDTENPPPVDLFVGTRLEMDEIAVCTNRSVTLVRAMRAAHDARDPAPLKEKAEELSRIADQMRIMSGHLASVLARHAKRRARLSGE